jgi:NAD(P)-dependent dehydrogenase (short-subunit alcohol dehydrogenase family)
MAKVLVIGASRGIGLETVKAALRAGHSVRALARSAASIPIQDAGLDKVSGDALDSDTIRNALQGVDVLFRRLGLISHLGRSSNAQICSCNPRASSATP